ncbi:MAG: hypothetical protein M3Y33_09920 [Actinomycetota bacterium]|nr:hypothetical protein [Actinomycetota bacterium]
MSLREKPYPPPGTETPQPPGRGFAGRQSGQHEHAWGIVAAVPSPHTSGVTVALLSCERCREPRTIQLSGTWTLEQVRGEPAA